MKKLAYIGLGVMGFPMAGHLRGAGFEVTVYNRSAHKANSWCSRFGGVAASSPAAAAADADMVFLCVGNDNDVREVVCGDRGVLDNIKTEAVVVDHSTTSAVVAREMDMACRQKGAFFIDAPVSGGQQGAENGRLTVMAGGDQEAFKKAAEVMACYAPAIKYLGPSGSGQLCKMVNQICIAGLVQGLAEGLAFAESSGLDPVSVVDAISKGAAQSWQMDNRHRTMVAGDYEHGFAVDWMRKDLGIVLDEARRNGAALPVTALVDQFYGEVQNMGGGRWDTSSLLKRLQQFRQDH